MMVLSLLPCLPPLAKHEPKLPPLKSREPLENALELRHVQGCHLCRDVSRQAKQGAALLGKTIIGEEEHI